MPSATKPIPVLVEPRTGGLFRPLMLGVAATLCCTTVWADDSDGLPGSKSLLASIKEISPNATILLDNEVDAKSCAPIPKSPTLVRADFNGDGFEDIAVLLRTSVSKDVTIWQGRELRKADFLFVIFLNDGKGGYLARTLDKFPGHVPVGAFLALVTSGKIRPMGAKKDLILSNPAVILTFCEKSAAAYVVAGTRVKEIPLSD